MREVIKNKEHLMFEVECNGDSLSFHDLEDRIRISVEEPWAGSTETGFGATCSFYLQYEQAKELKKWLEGILK